jgi:superfamily II DNA helicase RecQ
MEINTALSSIEAKYGFHFKEKQLSAIKSIVEGNDTFVVLPTGYGKSKIYMHFPEIFELVKKQKGTVLVISPLQPLMLDQLSKHNERDIPVLYNSVPLPA